MKTKFLENNKIGIEELVELYNSVSWIAYTQNMEVMENILENSYWYMSAYYENKLIGLIRVIGDGYSIMYIQDILVNPEYQRLGIGTNLIERALKKFKNIRQNVLITDDEERTKKFYLSVGMVQIEETRGTCFVKYNI